uniref:Uncharacterized protein n=1 Tax=viral metagenome TaxID=1070528 RepID=A0A6C0C9X9_9ZZZZ
MEINELLCKIVQTNQCDVTVILLKRADPNYVDADEKFPLFYAYESKNLLQMKILLAHGANVNKQYKEFSLLQYCCDDPTPEDMIRLLMDNKADPNILYPGNVPLIKYLTKNKSFSIIKIIASYPRTNLNLVDDRGATAFRSACSYGFLDIAILLLDKGADPNIQGNEGYTALIRSVINGRNNVTATLLLYDDIKLDLQDDVGNTALHYACIGKKIDIINLLLLHDACFNIKNKEGLTATEINEDEDIALFFKKYNKKYNKKRSLVINVPKQLTQLLFTVPIAQQHRPKKICTIDRGSFYQTWNNVFHCWNNAEQIPHDIVHHKIQCEYVDEKIPHHIINTDKVRFFSIMDDDGKYKYGENMYT